ncbi:hypothetical protein SS1G_00785 [Sclerotinia sclerotiorum 1980 UF-70]|uniref:HTH psq-type domain-containing protein n=1 Tax=Sclerotinia sclerotiorum (strain ATCC 18683 / 1980 / Ss-1) TaxID=665079 RepID=A7E660_SCLS1|nr:hypothetical protein SS1G_00785 [Sclerotinia sclerotiorum 1980 UF-70]EDN91382.1 hypothetical protein SS1G_00785 [Sclerotinia sclerotiorum 1980 UF-70]
MKPVPRDFWIEIFDVSNFGGFDDLCSSRLAWTTFYGIVNNKEMLILQSSDRIGVNKISMDDGQVRKHQCRSFGVRVDGDLDRRRSSLINYINTNSIIRSESSIFRLNLFKQGHYFGAHSFKVCLSQEQPEEARTKFNENDKSNTTELALTNHTADRIKESLYLLTWFIRTLYTFTSIITFQLQHAIYQYLIMQTTSKEARINLAIEAIRTSQNLSIRKAAKLYNIPHTTFTFRMNGILPLIELRLTNHKMTELEEKSLFQYILDMDKRGFSPRISDIEDIANYILETRGAKKVGKL